MEIDTELITASTLPIDHKLRSEKKVIEICKEKKAAVYINPIGGVELYQKENFKNENIDLHFIKTNDFSYKQFDNTFLPSLSIIDVMMFNGKEEIKKYLASFYTLI